MIEDLLLEVTVKVQHRDDRRPAEAVVAVCGIEKAAAAPLVSVEFDNRVRPLLAQAWQARQGFGIVRFYNLLELVGADGFRGLGGRPLVYAAHQLEEALYTLGVSSAPKMVNLTNRRESVVLLPAPDVLAYPLYRCRVFRDELDRHRVAYVTSVRPRQMLGRRHNLNLYRRRVERKVYGYARPNLLHEAAPEDVLFHIPLKHAAHILPSVSFQSLRSY